MNRPIQYKKGYVEFYKLKFKVTSDVLIPRPETELLVDYVLNYISQLSPETCNLSPITILDLGTGSGNIAVSLACNLKGCNVNIIAADISEKALTVARQNAKLHGVSDKITFIQSNLLEGIDFNKFERSLKNAIVVTNLPYIPSARIPYLDSSVKDFEPHVALDGGEDGFELYRKLFQQINGKGWKPKLIIGEIDYTHGELAATEAQQYFPNAQVEVKKDLAHLQRIITVQN